MGVGIRCALRGYVVYPSIWPIAIKTSNDKEDHVHFLPVRDYSWGLVICVP